MKFQQRTKLKVTLPGILLSMVHLQKLTTVLGNEIKCAIIQFIFYTPAVAKSYKELYVSQVLGLSLTCPSAVLQSMS